jgi:hypothetical protein
LQPLTNEPPINLVEDFDTPTIIDESILGFGSDASPDEPSKKPKK